MKRKQATEEQKQEAAERRAALKKIAAVVSAMSQEQREAMLSKFGAIVNCEGRALSLYNSVFILSQNPRASMVGGFRQWRGVGRKVAKGSKALAIWLPLGEREENTAAPANPGAGDTEETTGGRMAFRLVWVFDVTQTIEEGQTEAAGDALALDTVRHVSGSVVEPLQLTA